MHILNKSRLFALAALGIATLAACNKDYEPTLTSGQISVQAQIGSMTRVQTTGNISTFEAGDTISIYAWTGQSSAVPSNLVVDGARNGLGTDGRWTSKSAMLWADMSSNHYFLGICPARSVTDFQADPFTLDPDDYQASDLLVATNLSGIKPTENPVGLTFDHVMAKLIVNLSFRNQWATAPTVSSVQITAKSSATVNYLSKSMQAQGTAAGIGLTKIDNATWSGLQIPQDGVREITIIIEGKKYVFTHTQDIPLQGGRYTTVNLIVGRNTIDLESVGISNWLEGSTIDNGEAQTDD